MKWVALWTLVKGTGPALYLMAAAFAYGARKCGSGTWRNKTSCEHVDGALRDIADWKSGASWTVLVDAALRLAFAIAQGVPSGAEYKR